MTDPELGRLKAALGMSGAGGCAANKPHIQKKAVAIAVYGSLRSPRTL
jgi:hypothetical protein